MAGEETTKKEQGAINLNSGVAQTGLNMDQSVNQVGQGSLTYALNAAVENFDANSVNYQNEPGNEFCVQFPQGYVLIGEHPIYEQNKHIFFLHNPVEGKSEIGYMENNDCTYHTYISADCLNFNVNHPIHKVVHRITNCTTEIYWTDGINPRRYLDLSEPPYRTQPSNTPCDTITFPDIDCNKLKLQPNFNIPQLEVSEIRNGGDLTAGTYQFAIQYCDAAANGYTSYYSITNPTPIADTRTTTLNFDYKVGNSIVIDITNLDTTGYYQYFNLAVIKTINNASSVELVGTYYIDKVSEKIIYSGQLVSNKQLTILDIFEKFPFYEIAQDLTTVQDILVWDNLTSIDRINYQGIANKINLKWESYRIPETETYADELNATNLRGYLRDEVYAFEIVFLLKNGKQTDGFHIPGRIKTFNEMSTPDVPNTNQDFVGSPDSFDSFGVGYSPYWKIYNTASVTGFSPEYSPAQDYKGPYQYGEFAYWESNEEYPCDTTVWGDLAGQKIRHHKFPDVLVSPIYESKMFTSASSMVMSSNAVFPLGVRIDPVDVRNLILSSDLTSEQKDDIVGFKIVRGDRSNNKSIVAKGMLRNVGDYTREGTKYYFPNYPYNDLREDPFLVSNSNSYTATLSQGGGNIICRSFSIFVQAGSAVIAEYTNCYTGILDKQTIDNQTGTSTLKYDLCALDYPKPKIVQFKAGVPSAAFVMCNTYKRYAISIKFGQVTIIQPYPDNGKVPSYAHKGSYGLSLLPTYPNTLTWSDWGFGYANLTWDEYCLRYPNLRPCLACLGNVDFAVTAPTNYQLSISNPSAIVVGQVQENVYYYDSVVEPFCNGSYGTCDGFQVKEIGQFGYDLCNPTPLKAFETESNKYRLAFNSPETSFGKPFLGDILKLENVIFGAGQAHFVQVKDNAFYKLLTKEAQEDAYNSSSAIAAGNMSALFAAYQSYLTIYINGITRRNYSWSFNSIAKYSYHDKIDNNLGIKQRNLDIAQYINPTVQSVNDTIDINNWNRESSVFLRTDLTKTSLPFPKDTASINPTGTLPKVEDNSRFVNSDPRSDCNNPGKLVDINTVVYYASLKKYLPSQYGQMYQYTTIDTGYQINIPSITPSTNRIIFGGDTYISAFAFKTKLPFFIENRVGAPDDSDVFYDELGNVAYPKYWHSARSVLSNVGGLTNFISVKARSFDCPNSQVSNFGAFANPGRTYYDGKMYQFAYGVPSFYCESSVNVDLRQAFNDREGDFWPHVSTGIPDDWVQENRVPISQDNTYYYNATFSKQNKENLFTHLPQDWEEKLCFTNYPFRAIYSDPEEWLIYRPVSFFDFPQNYGKLTSLDGIQNRAILARFENKTLLYNKLLTIDTSNPQAAYIGNAQLFAGAPPIDFAETDLGYVGCQNKMLLKVPQGQVTVDAKRGQVFLLTGEGATDLTAFGSGMNRFFTDHLAFEILRYFPDLETVVNGERIVTPGVNTDNHFNGIGLHGVYDSKYDRVILTKLDYVPLTNDVKYDRSTKEFYVEEIVGNTTNRNVVYLSDLDYFCNKSWTISFNFNTKSWISFHSYVPNWYIAENNFFYSGLNGCCDSFDFNQAGFDIATSNLIIVGPPTTTSTTTDFVPPPPPPEYDCDFTGTAYSIDCELDGGTGIITMTTTTTTVCQRPINQLYKVFVFSYNAEGDEVVTTASYDDACAASLYLDGVVVGEITVNQTPVSSLDFNVGSTVWVGLGTDCTVLPDGWYVSNLGPAGNGNYNIEQVIYHVVGGVIVEIVPCICNDITTTTTSTTNNYFSEECCSMLYHNDNIIRYTDFQDFVTNPIVNVPGFITSFGIALSPTKFWAINTQIDEWDITLNPFVATFNRNIAFPVGFTTSSGIVAINNTTLIAVNDTLVPQKVVELDIIGLTAIDTNQFDLQANREAVGNPLYTTGGKLILINQDTISSDYYISQYDYATGTLEVDDIISLVDYGETPAALSECDCNIYVTSAEGTIYTLNNSYPYNVVPYQGLYEVQGAAQLTSCVNTGLITTTTTTTTV